jgi:hypothetical protein
MSYTIFTHGLHLGRVKRISEFGSTNTAQMFDGPWIPLRNYGACIFFWTQLDFTFFSAPLFTLTGSQTQAMDYGPLQPTYGFSQHKISRGWTPF